MFDKKTCNDCKKSVICKYCGELDKIIEEINEKHNEATSPIKVLVSCIHYEEDRQQRKLYDPDTNSITTR